MPWSWRLTSHASIPFIFFYLFSHWTSNEPYSLSFLYVEHWATKVHDIISLIPCLQYCFPIEQPPRHCTENSKFEKGRELPPRRAWQQFPALLYAPAVESRVRLNDQHTNFPIQKIMHHKWKQLILVVNFLFGLRANVIPNKRFQVRHFNRFSPALHLQCGFIWKFLCVISSLYILLRPSLHPHESSCMPRKDLVKQSHYTFFSLPSFGRQSLTWKFLYVEHGGTDLVKRSLYSVPSWLYLLVKR